MELSSKLQTRISSFYSYNMNTPKKRLPPDDKRNIFIFQLTPLWEHIVRMKRIPPDVNMDQLFDEICERLQDPEWEVRQHALRVMADLIPVMESQLDYRMFPLLNNILNNLGHSAPAVRKAALDILKIYFTFSKVPEDLLDAVTKRCDEKCSTLSGTGADYNIVTGVILSLPSLLNIVMNRRRNDKGFVVSVFRTLGLKLCMVAHQDVALRSLLKLKHFCGKSKFYEYFSMMDSQIRDKYRMLCEVHHLHDCNSNKSNINLGRGEKDNSISNSCCTENINEYRTDSSEETEFAISHETKAQVDFGTTEIKHQMSLDALGVDDLNNNVKTVNVDESIVNGKVIMETEIAFDSDTAITMTVLEEDRKREDINRSSYSEDESFENSSLNGRSLMKVYSDSDTEDTDVVVPVQKKVRFGGEEVKLRTPDSDNHLISEDEKKQQTKIISTRETEKDDENIPRKYTKSDTPERHSKSSNHQSKKSNIPIPISTNHFHHLPRYKTDSLNDILKMPRRKSKSLSELYDYFRNKSKPCQLECSPKKTICNTTTQNRENRKLTPLHIPKDYRAEDEIPSPLPPHREVEVLHNLQSRSPSISPQRTREKIHYSDESFSLTVYNTDLQEYSRDLDSDNEASSAIQRLYDWERMDIVPSDVVEQLHNTENWISLVKAVDRLHKFLHLNPDNLRALDAGGGAASLSDHMISLGAHVAGARSACERVQCVLVRGVGARTLRRLLPRLVRRLAGAPSPLALPHALLARISLHELVAAVLFGQSNADISTLDNAEASLMALTAVARAAGPAAVLAAAQQQLVGEEGCQQFCQQLRARLYAKAGDSEEAMSGDIRMSRIPVLPPIPTQSFLPRPRARVQRQQQRGRARSTPPPLRPLPPPHRLRPLTDSASAPAPPAILQQLPGSEQVHYEATKEPLAYFRLPTSVAVNRSCDVEDTPEKAGISNKRGTDEPNVTDGIQTSNNLSKATTSSPQPTYKLSRHVEKEDSLKEYEIDNNSNGIIEHLITKFPVKTNDRTDTLTPVMSRETSSYSQRSLSCRSIVVSPILPLETRPNTPHLPSTPHSSHSQDTSDGRGSRVSSVNSMAALSAVSSLADIGDKDSPIYFTGPQTKSVQSASSEEFVNGRTVLTPDPDTVELKENLTKDEKRQLSRLAPRVQEPSVSKEQLARCLALLESDDWEKVTSGLHEAERLCSHGSAAGAWRPMVRAIARHVRSLRSQVARAACHTLGRLFEEQGRTLENESEEASAPLLDRTADTNRFLRSDAEAALVQVSAGVGTARAVSILVSRGAGHRSGAVRSATARVLAEVCARAGATRVLSLQTELRARLLRAAADLLSDAGLDTRSHAKRLFIVLAEDPTFYVILKESIPPSKYKSIEKVVNRLRASH